MTPQEYLRIVRAAHQFDMARLQYMFLLTIAGFDPAKPHRFDDATLSIQPLGDDAPEQVE